MFILKVSSILDKHNIPYAIVGGHAVALHGAVRGTIDIDFITKWNLENLISIEKALNEINLSSRLPITPKELFDFKDDYIKNKNLIAWNFTNPDDASQQVDIMTAFDLKNFSVRKVHFKGNKLNIISKKDLIKMKRISGREQDILDIKALEKLDEI